MYKFGRAMQALGITLGFAAAILVAAFLVVLAKTAKDVALILAALLAPFVLFGVAWFGVYRYLGIEE